MSQVKLKDPDAVVDWSFDWNDGYLDTASPAETLSTSIWVIEPADSPGLTIDSSSKTDTVATAFLAGGVKGRVYRVTNRVTTSGGRTDDRTLAVRIEER